MARHARGYTLKEVADAAGCSEGLMSKIETGKADPSLRLLRKACQFFDISRACRTAIRTPAKPQPPSSSSTRRLRFELGASRDERVPTLAKSAGRTCVQVS
jgi:transcriptional regulator with XRE-family HTH domain